MSEETADATVAFIVRLAAETRQRKIRLTFHGGEPLVAGHAILRRVLDGIATQVGHAALQATVQSNLWLLDDEFCKLFQQCRVQVSTSLDGPECITDAQRGQGYFARTMVGIRKAEDHGLHVGCIATLTPTTLPYWREVFDFFIGERLGCSIHAAVPPLRGDADRECCASANSWPESPRCCLSATEYGTLLRQMLDYYVDHRHELSVSLLDQMCQGVGSGEGRVCTFRDCLGMFLAIDPRGDIYPCQRFCGQTEYRLGTLAEKPTAVDLFASPVAQRFDQRQQAVRENCRNCAHLDYCKGGCPYNAWAAHQTDSVRDPYCEAYRTVFDYIEQRLADEMAAEVNINAIAERPYAGHGHPLLRKGPLIELVREGPHPSQIARTAKRIIAAVELAKGPDIPTVATRLVGMGICRTQQTAGDSLSHLWKQLHPEKVRLNNLYLHVTFACQLHCTHCYARAGVEEAKHVILSVAALAQLVREAKDAGFRQVVITGGEPLTHPQRTEMLRILTEACRWARPMNLVLRTNLAMPLDATDLQLISAAFGQVVVSVDGSEQTHDARRGQGTYRTVVRNLEAYTTEVRSPQSTIRNPGELSLACVMRAADIQGDPGQAVRALASRLGIRRTRFRPLLPLGRAANWAEPPASEALGAHADPMELIENGFHPVASCGLGQNLYVEPSGESFPCYSYHRYHASLGNVIENSLLAILGTERFRDLTRHTVDTNPKCRECEVRYLCGGACRAWGGEAAQHDLDAPPPECNGLQQRASHLLATARDYLRARDLRIMTNKER